MNVRDVLAAAIAAHIGPAVSAGHTAHAWRSATFEGERHSFRYTVADIGRALSAAPALRDAEIVLHSGFCADVAMLATGPSIITVEILVVAD